MSPEKDAALVRDFPHLFRDRNAPIHQSPFSWGFECGEGWEPLIRSAAEKIEPIVVKMINDALKTKDMEALEYVPAASQIKEKFAVLRWYMTSSTDEIDAIIEEAEVKSGEICEQCGKAGTIRGKGWLYTACDACHEQYRIKHGK